MSHIPQPLTEPTNEWTGGICSNVCGGDVGTCLGAWFCACLLHGRTSSRYKSFPTEDPSMLNISCLAWVGASCLGVPFIPQMLRRMQMREKFGIRGSEVEDCCVSFWCTPCTLAQMNMEVKKRAEIARAATGSGVGYEKEVGGMVYAAPVVVEGKEQQQQQQPLV